MIRCPNCQNEIDNDANFCPYCGNTLDFQTENIPYEDPMYYPEDTPSYDPLPWNPPYPEPEPDRDSELRKKILIIAATAVLVIGIIVVLIMLFYKPSPPPDPDSSVSSVASDDLALTDEEAQSVIENQFQCYAVKTDEIKDTLTFDCYGVYDKQSGTYDNKLGTVQINRNTAMMNVVDWVDDSVDPGEPIEPEDSVLDEIRQADIAPSPTAATASTTVTASKYVYNCDFGLYLWKDTNCTDHYCIVYVGDEVGFIENVSGTKYAKVSYGNYIGYLNKNYLSDSKPNIDTTVKYSMYAISDGVLMRNGPSTNYSAIYSLPQNAEVGYISDMADHPKFVKVSYHGTIGYIAKSSLSTTKINTTVISYKYISNVDYAVYLYTTSSASKAYCMVLLGEKVGFIENATSTNYAKVNYNGTIGYINRKYLSDTKPTIDTKVKYTMYVRSDNTPLRKAPTSAGSIITNLPAGTEVGFIMTMTYATEYAKVQYNGTIGYILYSSLSDTKPQAEPDTPDTPSSDSGSKATDTPDNGSDNSGSNSSSGSDAGSSNGSDPGNSSGSDAGSSSGSDAGSSGNTDTGSDTSGGTETAPVEEPETPSDSSSEISVQYDGPLPAAGSGTAPTGNYVTMTVSVSSGALGLRNAKSDDNSNIISFINNGATVWVVDTTEGQYWYVYVPDLGQYGYVNHDYLK